MAGEELRKQGWPVEESSVTLWRAVGCPHCNQTGYQGRVAVFEFMEMDDDLRREVMRRADANALREIARHRGLRSLKEDGWLKVTAGVTTAEEVFRVTQQV